MPRHRNSGSGRFTVSGPGVDKSYSTDGVAQSAALTFADRSRTPATFYVRDIDGKAIARATRDAHRHTHLEVLR